MSEPAIRKIKLGDRISVQGFLDGKVLVCVQEGDEDNLGAEFRTEERLKTEASAMRHREPDPGADS